MHIRIQHEIESSCVLRVFWHVKDFEVARDAAAKAEKSSMAIRLVKMQSRMARCLQDSCRI